MKILRKGVTQTNIVPNGTLFNLPRDPVIMRLPSEDTTVELPTSNLTGVFATHRISTNTTEPIARLRGSVSGELDIYDVGEGTTFYRTSAGGAWVDGSGEDWYVVRWYDQLDATRYMERTSTLNQPVWTFNARNGWPEMSQQGSSLTHLLSGGTAISNYITNSVGYIFMNSYFHGTGPSGSYPSSLDDAFYETAGYLGIARGNLSGGGDKVHAWNYDSGFDVASSSFTIDTWNTWIWEHVGGNLSIWQDKSSQDTVASGNTGALTGNVQTTIAFSVACSSKRTMVVFYNATLTSDEISDAVDYCNAH